VFRKQVFNSSPFQVRSRSDFQRDSSCIVVTAIERRARWYAPVNPKKLHGRCE
jgi:hypothetical protein